MNYWFHGYHYPMFKMCWRKIYTLKHVRLLFPRLYWYIIRISFGEITFLRLHVKHVQPKAGLCPRLHFISHESARRSPQQLKESLLVSRSGLSGQTHHCRSSKSLFQLASLSVHPCVCPSQNIWADFLSPLHNFRPVIYCFDQHVCLSGVQRPSQIFFV